MPIVTNTPLESKYGFSSPGFTVDEDGNVIVKSIIDESAQNSLADDFIVSFDEGYIINSNSSTPPITLSRGRTYIFNLNLLDTHAFSILLDDNITLYNEGLKFDDGSTGLASQGKTVGRLQFAVPMSAPATLSYGNVSHNVFGTINVVDPSGRFDNISVTSHASDALSVTGGIIADTISSTSILVENATVTSALETAAIMSTGNLVLDFSDNLIITVSNTELGRINSTGLSVPINSTTIENTTIGLTSPSTASFITASVAEAPVQSTSIANKQYVDTTATSIAIAFGL